MSSRVSTPRAWGSFERQTLDKSRNRVTGMFTLYSMQRSGNCYKVRLALAQLALEYDLVEIDILKGETPTPEFLAKNPSGHVPLLKATPAPHPPASAPLPSYL